ncbi:MAG: Ig-like domain-containing protein [Clostridia bacterium]|nr:Ig-like domain-containing protein [Clostridia bacterium]
MKKKNVLMTTLAAATIALGCGAFAACGHTHTYSEDWKKDSTGHWHYATCDDLKEGDKDYKKDFAEHAWGDDNECDICHYIKVEAPTSSVSLDKAELALNIANTEAKLTATVTGGGGVTWSSSDSTVVSVNSESGDVEALKPGTATITATAENGDTATCEVTVDKAYYVIGGMDSAWNKAGVFGDSNVIYFMPTQTEGVYETKNFELPRKGDFQIAPVGDTSNNWWQGAFKGDKIAAGDTVLRQNKSGNIAVAHHGNYKVTLDLRGENPVVSGVLVGELPETAPEYYLRGDMNNWGQASTANDAGDYLFTNNNDGTYTLEIDLKKDVSFKVAVLGADWAGSLGEAAVPRDKIGTNGTATVDTDYQLTWGSGDNICVGVAGTYTFTLNDLDDDLDYTFEPNADTNATLITHYYIKGSMHENWSTPMTADWELAADPDHEGEYTMSLHLDANTEFMFYSKNVNSNDPEDITNGSDEIKSSKVAEGTTCVTDSNGNIKAVASGTYTFRYNGTTLTVEFTPDAEE